jgi:hypothetical protein
MALSHVLSYSGLQTSYTRPLSCDLAVTTRVQALKTHGLFPTFCESQTLLRVRERPIPRGRSIGLTLRLLVGGMAWDLASSPRSGQDRDRPLGDCKLHTPFHVAQYVCSIPCLRGYGEARGSDRPSLGYSTAEPPGSAAPGWKTRLHRAGQPVSTFHHRPRHSGPGRGREAK